MAWTSLHRAEVGMEAVRLSPHCTVSHLIRVSNVHNWIAMRKKLSTQPPSAEATHSGTDPRFSRIGRDPRFKKPRRKHTKIQIDRRFQKILTDKQYSETRTWA